MQSQTQTSCGSPPSRLLAKSGFTLVEVLVVIVIVAVLATVVMTIANRSIQNAKASTCMSNMRQIGTMMNGYAAEHSGYFPEAGSPRGYVSRLCENVFQDSFPQPDDPQASKKRQQFFRSQTGIVFICPSRKNYIENFEKTYLANGFIVGAVQNENPKTYVGNGTNAFVPKHISRVYDPPRAFLLMECGADDEKRRAKLWTGNDVRYLNDSEEYRNCDCHKGGRHYLFVDGHVEWLAKDPAIGNSENEDIYYRAKNPDS